MVEHFKSFTASKASEDVVHVSDLPVVHHLTLFCFCFYSLPFDIIASEEAEEVCDASGNMIDEY